MPPSLTSDERAALDAAMRTGMAPAFWAVRDPGRPAVIAPAGFMEEAVSENVLAGNAMTRRAQYMYGALLPRSAGGQVDAGLGKATSRGTVTLIPPTDLVSQPIDTRRIDECYPAVDYFEKAGLPFVVAVNLFDGRLSHAVADIRWALAIGDHIPLISFDARVKLSVRDALLTVLRTTLARTTASQG